MDIFPNVLTQPIALYAAIVATLSFLWNIWKHYDERRKYLPIGELTLKKTTPSDLVLYISVINRKNNSIKVNKIWVTPKFGIDIALRRAHQQEDVFAAVEMVGQKPPWVIDAVLSKDARIDLTAYAMSGFEKLQSVRIEWSDIGPSQATHIITIPVRLELVSQQFASRDDF